MNVFNLSRIGLGLFLGVNLSICVAGCSEAVISDPGEFSAERVWARHPELVISARAVRDAPKVDDEFYEESGLYALVMEVSDIGSKKSMLELCVSGALVSDAISLRGLSIDTAPFVLSEDVDAFGVRAKFENSSGPNPASYESFMLFARVGNDLAQVLSEKDFRSYSSEVSISECAGTFKTKDTIIVLADEVSNGFKDLALVSKLESGSLDSDCGNVVDSFKKERRRYRYNGQMYVISDDT